MDGLKDEELERLRQTKSEVEWNAACDEVKRARGGKYPADWFQRVMISGVLTLARANWR